MTGRLSPPPRVIGIHGGSSGCQICKNALQQLDGGAQPQFGGEVVAARQFVEAAHSG